MNMISRLARAARRVWRFPARKSAANDIAGQTRRAKAQLRTRIPPHLLKDVGVEDG